MGVNRTCSVNTLRGLIEASQCVQNATSGLLGQRLVKIPEWDQRNIISWVRRLGPSWTVHVLDLVEELLPEAILNRTMTGPHVGQHSSDLIRLPLIYLSGGVWMQVGMLLFRRLDELCWNIFMLFNGFIPARKGSLVIKYQHEIFLTLWKDSTSCEGMHTHTVLQYLPTYEPPALNGKRPPFMYAQHLTDSSVGWDRPRFFDERVLLFDCVLELLNLRQDGGQDVGSGKVKETETLVQGVLGMSTTIKVSHGLVTAGRENHDADIRPGTFAAYLRGASATFEQTKELAPVKMVVMENAVLQGARSSVLATGG
ncbi:hypothetical protein BJX99DRAFT_245033 [Aspergillus californicus]